MPALRAAEQPAAFEVVSVKANPTTDFRSMRMQVLPGGRLSATALPLRALLVYAYNLPMNFSERLTGVPDWANRALYDVEAKPPAGAFPEGLPTSEMKARFRAMVQTLLADRFKLAIRKETKEMPVYALSVASGGPKMQPSSIREEDCPLEGPSEKSCHQFMGGQGRGLHAKAVDMSDLAGFIENWTDHPVLDRTGLGGLFAMDTEGWIPMNAPQPQPGIATPNPTARPNGDGDPSDPTRPTLFMVLRRLGLDLKQTKGTADIYVVEHLEKPTEN
jgi:uncharacterized protein (TIGR03435 family)